MKRGTIEHPKTLQLSSILGLEKWGAVGILECLWHFASRYAPQGNVGKFSDQVITDSLGWKQDPKILISALIECKFLEIEKAHRLIIHDWSHHADDAVNKYLRRRKLRFADGLKPFAKVVTKARPRHAAGTPEARPVCDQPEPLPLPTPEPLPTPITHSYLVDPKFKELWISFLEMRKSIKAKPTAKAIELLMKKLHAQSLAVACEMLERSIENNWRGVFPPKGNSDGKRKSVVKEWCDERGVDLGGVRQGDGDLRGVFPTLSAGKK